MVRIRLRRTGKRGQPSYRVVVADREAPRDGRFIEILGHYNPRTEPVTAVIDADRALYWLSQGAQPSDAVVRLLRKQGILARFEAIKSGAPDPGPGTSVATEEAASEGTAQADAELEAAAEAEADEEIEAEMDEAQVAEDAEEDEAEPDAASPSDQG
jgi:small subunit ribosomal protein S16